MQETKSFPSPYRLLLWFFEDNIYLRAQKFRQELMVNGSVMRRRQKYGDDGKLNYIEIIQAKKISTDAEGNNFKARKISIDLNVLRSEEW